MLVHFVGFAFYNYNKMDGAKTHKKYFEALALGLLFVRFVAIFWK
jgi:hypothetical protein